MKNNTNILDIFLQGGGHMTFKIINGKGPEIDEKNQESIPL